MIFHLKRFVFDKEKGRTRKIERDIQIPESIELDPDKAEIEDREQYHLKSFLAHLGSSPSGGHYVAYAKI